MIGLKTPRGDLFWFDAVLNRGEAYSTKVTSHPIETGASITDHAVIANDVFNVTGVISVADINVHRPIITQQDMDKYKYDKIQFVSASSPEDSVIINESAISTAMNFLPEGVSALAGNSPPKVSLPTFRGTSLLEVKGQLLDIHRNLGIIDLLVFNSRKLSEVFTPCVITSINFSEDPDTGASLHVSMTLERLVFVTLESTHVGKLTWKEIQLQATKSKNTGAQQGSKANGDDGKPVGPDKPADFDGLSKCFELDDPFFCFNHSGILPGTTRDDALFDKFKGAPQ